MAFKGTFPAPGFTTPPYGIDSGATVVNHTGDDQHWVMGYEQENALCTVRGTTWAQCSTSASTDLVDPDIDAGDRWSKIFPFLVVAEDLCGEVLNARRPETQKQLLKTLDALSIKGAERELWTGAHAEEEGNQSKSLSNGADMVGTGLTPSAALAAVEDALAYCLPGVRGTIHMTPGMANLFNGPLNDIDGELVTLAGSRVIVGAGYALPNDTPAIYGTGPVIVHLGESAMVTDDLAQMADIKHNEFTLRAERAVAVTFDGCCHVGATVTLS